MFLSLYLYVLWKDGFPKSLLWNDLNLVDQNTQKVERNIFFNEAQAELHVGMEN